MQFYIISPPQENKNFHAENFEKISNILPIKFFQFRPKYKNLKKRFEYVKKYYDSFSKICKKKKIKLIINDDFEIAEKFFFDGIHLGQKDRSCEEAKEKFGEKFLVGLSCSQSNKLVTKAQKLGADYLAFGPMFRTKTKQKKEVDHDHVLTITKRLTMPFVLIGGIDHSNLINLNKIHPNYIAIINSLWNFNKGPIKSALRFKEIIKGIA